MSYELIESPNRSDRKGNKIAGLICHGTAGGETNGSIRWMCNQILVPDKLVDKTPLKIQRDGKWYYNAQAAAHYITGRDGSTKLLVPEQYAAWHAGSGTTKPILNGRSGLNLWTIGHEICNWLCLVKRSNKFYTMAGDFTFEYKGPAPVRKPTTYAPARDYCYADGSKVYLDGVIEYWEPYTDEAINSTILLWKDLVARYGITKENIAGHEKVDPSRKIDPGPAFPWAQVLTEVFPVEKPVITLEPTHDEHVLADIHSEARVQLTTFQKFKCLLKM